MSIKEDSFSKEIIRIKDELDNINTRINDLVADLFELKEQYEGFIK